MTVRELGRILRICCIWVNSEDVQLCNPLVLGLFPGLLFFLAFFLSSAASLFVFGETVQGEGIKLREEEGRRNCT